MLKEKVRALWRRVRDLEDSWRDPRYAEESSDDDVDGKALQDKESDRAQQDMLSPVSLTEPPFSGPSLKDELPSGDVTQAAPSNPPPAIPDLGARIQALGGPVGGSTGTTSHR